MQTVYRIEHGRIGAGPFVCKGYAGQYNLDKIYNLLEKVYYELVEHVQDDRRFPIMWNTLGCWDSRIHRCGAIELKQLSQWIGRSKRTANLLHRAGFKVKEYEVMPLYVHQIRNQCAFEIAQAQLIKEHPISVLLH